MEFYDYSLGIYFHLHSEFFSVDQEVYWRNKKVWGNSTYETDGNGYTAETFLQHHLIFSYDINRTIREN